MLLSLATSLAPNNPVQLHSWNVFPKEKTGFILRLCSRLFFKVINKNVQGKLFHRRV